MRENLMSSKRIITLAVVLVLGACGGSGGDDDVLGLGDQNLDRCSLITSGEAEQWIGAPIADPAPAEGFDGEPDPVTCFYENPNTFASFLIQVYDGEVFFAEEGSAARTGETIEGLGDDAWMGEGKVGFLQGNWSASVSRISGTMANEDILEAAEIMSSRLP